MKKKIIALLLAASMTIGLSGCSNVTVTDLTPDTKDKVESMFISVENANVWTIVYHRETKVMYAVSRGGYNNGNFTLLVDADGNPMVWED